MAIYLLLDLGYHLLSVPNQIGNATGALAVPIVSLLEIAFGVAGIVLIRRLWRAYRIAAGGLWRVAIVVPAILTTLMAGFNLVFAGGILLMLFGD